MKRIRRAIALSSVALLVTTVTACSSTIAAPEVSTSAVTAPSCPNQKNTTTITGLDLAASYPLLEDTVRTNQCAKYIPDRKLQEILANQITPDMDNAARIAAIEEYASSPSGIRIYSVGTQLDGRYVFVFTNDE